MLQAVKELRESITIKQREEIDSILGDDLAQMLYLLLQSITYKEVEDRMRQFTALAKKSPVKILRMRRKLTAKQKSLIMQFIKDES